MRQSTASEISFAQRVLPFNYDEVVDLQSGKKRLLFAAQHGGPSYSELHMASGERSVMRFAQQITRLSAALVLIDEVEAGLHPWVQQLLMLELQRLALRDNLQAVVTTHSPVVLDAVPENGRIFLQPRALQKFGQADNMIYVLDGDARGSDHERKLCEAAADAAGIFFLPETEAPEVWMWDQLRLDQGIAAELGLSSALLHERMSHFDALYGAASDTPSNLAKSKLADLADATNRSVGDIGRLMARRQAADVTSYLKPLVDDLADAITRWREPS